MPSNTAPSLSRDRFSRYEDEPVANKIFMEGHGNPIVVGRAELLRRFFLKVYTKLTTEGLEEAGERPPRGGAHGGDVRESTAADSDEYSVCLLYTSPSPRD